MFEMPFHIDYKCKVRVWQDVANVEEAEYGASQVYKYINKSQAAFVMKKCNHVPFKVLC